MRRMYFVGVTTAQSSIHKLFPEIAELAGILDAELTGIDIPVNGAPGQYTSAMRTISGDPDSWGALVTTHKVNLYQHATGYFTSFDDDARLLGEISCIVKRESAIHGIAVDPIASMLAYDDLGAPQGDVLIFGAGGAATAIAVALRRLDPHRRIVLTDVHYDRLAHVRHLTGAEIHLADTNQQVLAAMPAGSFVINATGMGKDIPGSPIGPDARWPSACNAWDLNYRGDLLFLHYAAANGAIPFNGWDYFLHGWTQIMARVYGFSVTPDLLARIRDIARR